MEKQGQSKKMWYTFRLLAFVLAVGMVIPVCAAYSAISFGHSVLQGAFPSRPTSLQFGPDGRLYVSEQGGNIKIYTVVRNGNNAYQVTNTETLTQIRNMVNHNDDGALTGVAGRQVTGILVTGTGANPIIYAGSGDPRIGAGGSGTDTNLDTNSGIISKLTFNGASWDKVDLVRGLPRSEENHATNGLQLDEGTQTLFVAQGGNTNAGGPSNNFAKITEYALSAAILSIDLAAIEAMPTQFDSNTNSYYKYDLPTLDDPSRGNPGEADPSDPFGGNDGLNQAKIVVGGPVQVYSPGYRNPYDVVITRTPGKAGRMYAVDNGPNGGWGGYPVGEGPLGVCTNDYDPNEPGFVNNLDNLHFVTGPGYYAGHPVPIRANPEGAGLYWFDNDVGQGFFDLNPTDDWPPVPPELADPVQCDYREPGPANGALLTFQASTNGITEYSATNFDQEMQGDLLTASFDGKIYRMVLNAEGDQVVNGLEALFSNFGSTPLDVTAQGDNDSFPGTVWVAVYGSNQISIFEPSDYDGTGPVICSGDYDATLDEDGDGYTNADEIDSNANPCSSASSPNDWDGDFLSDLNDPDDDNDGVQDTVDFFQVDPNNGQDSFLPIDYQLFNTYPGFGFFGVGMTGLMANGQNYSELLENDKVVAGGASGLFTLEQVSSGDATGGSNTLKNAFQFGINVNTATPPLLVRTRLLGPFFGGITPVDGQTQGMYIGSGDQSNYIKIVLTAGGGLGGLQVLFENNDAVVLNNSYAPEGILSANYIDLYFKINPADGTVLPSYAIDGGMAIDLGSAVPVSGATLNALQGSSALAVGFMATANQGAPTFSATWDFIEITEVVLSSRGSVRITPTGGLNASTYSSGSFQIQNTSTEGQNITQFRIDLASSLFPDMIYDPDGLAGDTVAKDFTINSNPGTGYLGYNLSGFHNGIDDSNGYDVLEVFFDDFDPGELFTFSIDVDPSSIQGSQNPGPGESGSVSGLELTGASITMAFDDGSTHSVETFRIPSNLSGSENIIRSGAPPKPLLEVIGIPGNRAVVTNPSQFVRINAPGGSHARLLVVEGALFTDGLAGGGYDIDPFEANSALNVNEISADLGGDGFIELPINLTRSDENGGLNYIVAALEDADGMMGPNSDVIVLSYQDSPTSTLYHLNSGGPALATGGTSWSADQYFVGASNVYNAVKSIGGTTDDVLYQTERYGSSFGYSIPVEPGTYLVKLHFAETYFTSAGSRVFNVNVENGQGILSNFDIASEVGPDVALVKSFSGISVTDGTLNISFNALVNNAKISAIEVLSDTGGTPAILSASPNPLSFGTREPGSATTQVLTLSNTGLADLAVTDVVLSGGSGDFSYGGATGFTVSPGSPVVLNIDFHPAAEGAKSAVLTITHDGDNSPLTVNLTGTAEAPGTGGAVYRINSGGPAVTLGGVSWSADQYYAGSTHAYGTATPVDGTVDDVLFQTERYGKNMSYSLPVAPGTYIVNLYFAEIYFSTAGSRVFNVTVEDGQGSLANFDIVSEAGPDAAVAKSFSGISVTDGSLNISFTALVDNAKISAIEVLSASGGAAAVLSASPNPLSFGTQSTNSSTSLDLTLSNTGDASLSVSAVTISGDVNDFDYSLVTPVAVDPGSPVTFSVEFAPAAVGSRTAQLSFTHDGDNSPLTIDLIGEGADLNTAVLSASPNPLSFGTREPGSATTQVLTLSNTGLADLAVTDVVLSGGSGDFSYGGATGFTVSPGSPVALNIDFHPAAEGAKSAVLTITHDGDNSPVAVALSGTASPPSEAGVLYRVNAGGAAIAASDGSGVNWSADTGASPSTYVNAALMRNAVYASATPVVPDSTVPADVPAALFQTERYDPSTAAPEMVWRFPVANGNYEVRLYFSEIYSGTFGAGLRQFDVFIEGALVLDNYDPFTDAGGAYTGVMRSFDVDVADGELEIAFGHVVQHPNIKGIEIIAAAP